MSETTAQLIPILHYLSGAGAGVLASLCFDLLRARIPLPQARPASPLARLGLALLYAPRYSFVTVLFLSTLSAIVFGVLLALLEGQPVLPVVDAAIAILISQARHKLLNLNTELPAPEAVKRGNPGRNPTAKQ